MKIVINRCFGGFSLSDLAVKRLAELYQKEWHLLSDEEKDEYNNTYENIHLTNRPEDRSDKLLIQVVEELGDSANGACAELSIVEIPDDVDYEIDEYDGLESIHEKHRVWS